VIRKSRRVTVLAVAGAFALTPAITGCGAGHEPQSASPTQLTEGVNVSTKSGVEVRNLFVLGPGSGQKLAPGAAAPVYAFVVNNSTDDQPDRLIAVGSPVFQQGARIAGGGVGLPVRQPVQLGAQTPGQPAQPIVLGGLTQTLIGGESIQLTLRFERGGDITTLVPVVPHTGAYTTYAPAPPAGGAPAAPGAPASPGAPGTATPPATPGAAGSPSAPTSLEPTGGSASPSPTAAG
jgi:copper(I)-binding protein